MGPYIAAGQPPSAAMRLSWHEEMPRLSQEPALAEAQPLVSEGEPELTAPVRDAPPAAVTAMRALHVLSSTTSRQLVSGIIMCAAIKWCVARSCGFRMDFFLPYRSPCSSDQALFPFFHPSSSFFTVYEPRACSKAENTTKTPLSDSVPSVGP